MSAPRSSLATFPVLPAKGSAARPEPLPVVARAGGGPAPAPVPPVRPGTVSTNFRMPPEMQHALKERSYQSGVSINSLILEAVAAYLASRSSE